MSNILTDDLGANVDVVDKDMCTPLHNAAFTGELKCVVLLLQSGKW
jgi:hypothetical protein